MNAQFKKGVVEMCVLNLICQKDRYGYELIETISQEIEISEGTIYPILRRLTKDGYFDTYLKESTGGPPRKYYKITEAGKSAAQEIKSDWVKFGIKIKKIIEGEGE